MSIKEQPRQIVLPQTDEAILAALGYKQEFKREFTPLEVRMDFYIIQYKKCLSCGQVFGIAFSIIGLAPSISSVLFYAIPNGGGPAMVWGVRITQFLFGILPEYPQWLVASIFILTVGLSMAELASAAPTSGGVSFVYLVCH
jgi:hypothetical protein